MRRVFRWKAMADLSSGFSSGLSPITWLQARKIA
jgi:hypothetical protein